MNTEIELEFPCSAIIQRGYCVFGVGETPSEAIADAASWLECELTDEDFGQNDGDLAIVDCTRRLMERVRESGGDLAWKGSERDGIYLPEEESEVA